jgi:(2S)-methylsuccinyl-CoA dehydrogenase
MSESAIATDEPLLLDNLLPTCREALASSDSLLGRAQRAISARIAPDGQVDGALLETEQFAAHGYAWLSTYVEALRQMLDWGERTDKAGRFGEREALMLQAAYGEYFRQIIGGIAMSQGELFRLVDLNVPPDAIAAFLTNAVGRLARSGNTPVVRHRLCELIAEDGFADPALGDETLGLMQDQFNRFADEKIAPYCQEWHIQDELIPLPLVEELSELGVFGLTVPEEYGGLGLGKMAMCVVTEELSRGYIGVGSLGTRSEIAAELIKLGGTEAQKQKWLPRIASGEVLPTAVFTEPNTGSDLGSLRTRAERDGDVYRIHGNKTWITHGARSDMMTLLVRSNPDEPGYRGLSMFLAEKPRGTDADPFPADGMSGGEIRVLGYRGMKEYEIGFDGFVVAAENLLGETEGDGFKQLMATFESARIQTAARAVGVAQNALELALTYAKDRIQFRKPLVDFPRISGKIAWMAVETMISRQLSYFAARQKDSDRRCDVEAGMAKLLAARTAWSNADNAVQIHGGNGYAVEYPVSRVLCDARILNIFEGTAEIQANVIVRGLLGSRN